MSGIAAAVTNNGKGVASVAPGAQLVVAKALDSSGSGYDDDVAAGIRWVVDHGAQGDHESRQRHRVERVPVPVHDQHGRHQ